MKSINLTRKLQVLVDDDDYERANAFRWYAQVIKRKDKEYVYAARRTKGTKAIYLHRLLMGVESCDIIVDHKNRNTLDCRKENLRKCSRRENNWNSVKPSLDKKTSSSCKGVTLEGKKWRARIRVNGKRKDLGSFVSEELASQAYKDAALKIQGEFRCECH